jgi:hypothetical protein
VVVPAAADQDAHGAGLGFAAQPVVDEGDVEAELGGVFGLEFAGFDFDDEVARGRS